MNKKFYTYVLYSYAFKRLYIGHTDNLENRIKRHNNGYVSSTKPFKPYKIIYFEEFDSREKAIQRERELKSLEGRNFVKQFIETNIS
ncbi:MAG TPA: GIY-YIG nuclease family protein [Ignavibacteria bacterium]|nr:GIY-YIG nuclease family protein [Ignavibacteria bacterium]